MFKIHNWGLALACLITAAAVSGAALIIALDFTGIEGLGHAWSGLSGLWAARAATAPAVPATAVPAAETPLADRLKGVGEIDLFTVADVPGSTLKVHTGTAYANAQDLAQGRVALRWCYAGRGAASSSSSFAPTVTLGTQKGVQAPVLLTASSVSADEARQLGVGVDALLDYAHRLCRFGG